MAANSCVAPSLKPSLKRWFVCSILLARLHCLLYTLWRTRPDCCCCCFWIVVVVIKIICKLRLDCVSLCMLPANSFLLSLSMQNSSAALNCGLYLSPVISGHFSTPFPAAAAKLHQSVQRMPLQMRSFSHFRCVFLLFLFFLFFSFSSTLSSSATPPPPPTIDSCNLIPFCVFVFVFLSPPLLLATKHSQPGNLLLCAKWSKRTQPSSIIFTGPAQLF